MSNTESINVTTIPSGSFEFKVNNSATKGFDTGESITSNTFTIGGYDWVVILHPQGQRPEDKGLWISLRLQLRSKSQQVSVIFEFNLLDKDGSPSQVSWRKSKEIFQPCKDSWGWYQTIKREEIESNLIDDCFTILCSISITDSMSDSCSFVVPPSNLHEHFSKLLLNKERADVTFEVEGEIFHAHRLVLAARSSVFKAELFGPLNENNFDSIKIKDVQPFVFKAMLHFIYTDLLLDDKELDSDQNGLDNTSTLLAQHLLAAADRFALDRLKLMCEEELCENITIETVATTLALAEQHNCHHLKDRCFEFAIVPTNFYKIALTQGYRHLLLSCPSVLDELGEKLKNTSI